MAITHAQSAEADFEALYLAVREREQRVYTDAQVSRLPNIDAAHIHYREWETRKRSARRLVSYLKKKNTPLNILEVGCGNGWLTAKLAAVPFAKVTGLDINQVEINQALRVFKTSNLRFVCDLFNQDTFGGEQFDIIIFAAVLPYFPSVKNILQTALNKLSPGGEIHIADTHFYKPEEALKARKRCIDYYNAMGFTAMAAHYHHHTMNDMIGFHYHILLNPGSLVNRLLKKERFYWITVTK